MFVQLLSEVFFEANGIVMKFTLDICMGSYKRIFFKEEVAGVNKDVQIHSIETKLVSYFLSHIFVGMIDMRVYISCNFNKFNLIFKENCKVLRHLWIVFDKQLFYDTFGNNSQDGAQMAVDNFSTFSDEVSLLLQQYFYKIVTLNASKARMSVQLQLLGEVSFSQIKANTIVMNIRLKISMDSDKRIFFKEHVGS
ncbi:hypothetical protein FQR65_LT13202 [Abscondita terminalis]|nr:hypothetical protein FQR65_LT13202 [Abscondita terminalis]